MVERCIHHVHINVRCESVCSVQKEMASISLSSSLNTIPVSGRVDSLVRPIITQALLIVIRPS